MARTRLQSRESGSSGESHKNEQYQGQVKRSQTGSVEDLEADQVFVDIAARGSALLQSVASQGNQQVLNDSEPLPDLFSLPPAQYFDVGPCLAPLTDVQAGPSTSGRVDASASASHSLAELPLTSSDMLFERGMQLINWQESSLVPSPGGSNNLEDLLFEQDPRPTAAAAAGGIFPQQAADPAAPASAEAFQAGDPPANPFAGTTAERSEGDSPAHTNSTGKPTRKRRRGGDAAHGSEPELLRLPSSCLPLQGSFSAPARQLLPSELLNGLQKDTQWSVIRMAQQQLSAGTEAPSQSVLTASDVISQPLLSSDVKKQDDCVQDRIQQSLSWARQHCHRKPLKMKSRLASAPADMTTTWREKSPEAEDVQMPSVPKSSPKTSGPIAFRQAMNPIRSDPMIPWGSGDASWATTRAEPPQAADRPEADKETAKTVLSANTDSRRISTGYRVRSNELRISSPMRSSVPSAPAEPASAGHKSSQLVTAMDIQQAPTASLERLNSAAQGVGNKVQDADSPLAAAAESCGPTPQPSQPGTPAPVSIRSPGFNDGSTVQKTTLSQDTALPAGVGQLEAEVLSAQSKEILSAQSKEHPDAIPPAKMQTENERPLEESTQGCVLSTQSLNAGKLHKFLRQLQTIQAKATQLEVERQAVALWAAAVERADQAVVSLVKELEASSAEGMPIEEREARLKTGAQKLSELIATAAAIKRAPKVAAGGPLRQDLQVPASRHGSYRARNV